MLGILGMFNDSPKNLPIDFPKNAPAPFILINQTSHFATIKLNKDFVFMGRPLRKLTLEHEALWYEYLYEKHHLVLIKGRFDDEYAVCQKLCETIAGETVTASDDSSGQLAQRA